MDGWKETTLGEVVELKRGYDLPKSQRTEGTVPIISSSGISGFHAVSKCRPPGVVTGRYGTIGEVFFVSEDYWPLNTTLYVRDFKGNDPQFIYYFLKLIDYHSFSDKAAVPGVNRNHLHEAKVRVPKSKRDQFRIAETLGALDDKIELNRKTNETLEAMAQAIFKDWFVDFGPVRRKMAGASGPSTILGGLLPPNAPNASEIANLFPDRLADNGLPEGWEAGTLGEFAKNHSETMDFSQKPDAIFVNTGDVLRGQFNHCKYSPTNSMPGQAKKCIRKGDILFSEIRPKNHRYAYVSFDAGDHVVSTKFMVLRTISTIRPEHLYFLVTRPAAISEFNTVAESRSGTFPQITFDAIKHYPITVGSTEVMDTFADLLKLIFQKQSSNEKQNSVLAETRDYLLPRLMNGSVNVGDITL